MEKIKTEVHPFAAFVPNNTESLILGSFPCLNDEGDYGQWFYCGSGRNLFWKLLEEIYETDLQTIEAKKKLLTTLKLGITDIFYKIQRKSDNRKVFCKDTNIEVVTTNIEAINKIFKTNSIQKIYFTSKYVESSFQYYIKPALDLNDFTTVTLLSPSPQAAIAYSTRQEVIDFLKTNPNKKIKNFIKEQYISVLPKK